MYERAMRNVIIWIAAVIATACGPSGKQIAMAKQARYQGDKLVLFNAMKTATADKYQLEMSDETQLGLRTVGRWYTPEGLAASERQGDMRDVPDNSLNIMFVVKLLPEGQSWVVSVDPKMLRYRAGRPNPDVIAANDPSVPGWATGKVDQLYASIHDALKQYEVKSVGGVAPAPAPEPAPAAPPAAPAPAPAPAEPAPTAPQ